MNSKGQAVVRALLLLSAWVVFIPLSRPFSVFAQGVPYERTYPNLKAEVEKTLRNLQAYAGGRLPVLEGFVSLGNEAPDRYERAYYQYSIQVLTTPSGRTLVRVAAKITAWYSDPDPSRSGYRELPSNGRLESDLLERLDDALGNKSSLPTTGSGASPGIAAPSAKVDVPLPVLRGPAPVPVGSASAVSSGSEASTHAAAAASVAPTEADVEALRKRREAVEKRVQELNATAQNLEEILRHQAHPRNLAVVRKSNSGVFTGPEDNARMLFRAEAEDEFEVLDLQRDWILVQISGISRGWIRRSHVDLPEAPVGLSVTTGNSDSGHLPAEPFRIVREETVAFAGNWEPLKGKTVRLIWVQPTAQDEKRIGPLAKLSFAKTVFLKAASDLTQSPAGFAGVVIVFDSADGGQAAAPLTVLEQWKSGTLSDVDSWKQISLDPPEAFHTRPQS